MNSHTWILKTEIFSNFLLVGQDDFQLSTPPHPSFRNIKIEPVFNEKQKQTGRFMIEIHFVIKTEEEKPKPHIPADIGRDIFNIYMDLLTFLSGYPIILTKQIVLYYEYPDHKNFRQLVFPTVIDFPSPPIPLTNKDILSKTLDKKKREILAWFRRGLQEKNIINSILAFFISLEILSNQFPCEVTNKKICSKCGNETTLKPGTRQKVENLLLNEIRYTPNQFESIWDQGRNKLFHGGLEITADNERELHKLRDDLIVAIVKGMKKLLKLKESDPPTATSWDIKINDPIADIEF